MPTRGSVFATALVLLQGTVPHGRAGAAPERQEEAAEPSFPALATGIGRPSAVAVDASGAILVAAPDARRIFKLGASRNLTVVAADGTPRPEPGRQPSLLVPVSLAVDAAGNLYVVNDGDRTVRRIDGRTGMSTTVLGSAPSSPDPSSPPGPAAPPEAVHRPNGSDPLVRPWGLATNAAGHLYVSDRALHTVFRWNPSSGQLEAVAGSGLPGYGGDGSSGVAARLSSPEGLAVDRAGNLFVADRANHCVRRVDARTRVITTVAGNGFPGSAGDGAPASSAQLRDPVALAVDGEGHLFIADLGNARVRRVDRRTGLISTPSGLEKVSAGALAMAARTESIIVADVARHKVLRRDANGALTTIAGNGSLGYAGDGGPPTSAYLSRPAGLARDAEGNLYIVEKTGNRVRRIDSSAAVISTIAGVGQPGFSGEGASAVMAALNAPEGIAFDHEGRLLIADTGNHRVRRVARDGSIATIAGSGRDGLAEGGQPAMTSDIGRPSAVAVDADGALIVVQGQYGLVHRVDAAGTLRTIAGNRAMVPLRDGQPATSGRVERISAVAVGPKGDLLLAEEGSSRIWSVDLGTQVATVVAGRGLGPPSGPPDEASGVTLGFVQSLAVDAAGNLYIGDFPHGIRRIDAATRRVTTVGAFARGALHPAGLLAAATGILYVADGTGYVRRLDADGRLVTVAGGGLGF